MAKESGRKASAARPSDNNLQAYFDCTAFRTEKRRKPQTGQTYPWIVGSTTMVNHYYFYCVDKDFGPLFLKSCSYFPYTAKLCLNGQEYLKRQLDQEGINYEALDRGNLLACICHKVSSEKSLLQDSRKQEESAPPGGPAARHAAGAFCRARPRCTKASRGLPERSMSIFPRAA